MSDVVDRFATPEEARLNPLNRPQKDQMLAHNLDAEIECARCKEVYPRKFYGDVDNGRVANLQDNGKDSWCWDCLGKYVGKLSCSSCTRFWPKDMFSEEERAKGIERQCERCFANEASASVSFLTKGMTRELAQHQENLLRRVPVGPVRGSLPHVFLDIEINRQPIGRIEVMLRSDVVPQTAENFRLLCTGEMGRSEKSGKELCLRGCPFHRATTSLMVLGGDITKKDGTGGESIFGRYFKDENFKLKHKGPGTVGMWNTGKDTNNSQFYITLVKTDWLDDRHVVFGEVSAGMHVVKEIERVGSLTGHFVNNDKVVIADCGELPFEDGEQDKVVEDTETSVPEQSRMVALDYSAAPK
ncbi:hypothetical protein AB1Y20_012116 [Prymnesium parvum]|uniref:peptidylprolyl isomerase n=1 Tax=Prymnesium parvum TaxID=97485 RepID=A0AB34IQB5_PRYPA